MMHSQAQTELVQLIQQLQPEQVHRVLNFARTVKAEPPVDYSDEWTEEDMRDLSNESFRRMDELDPYDWTEK